MVETLAKYAELHISVQEIVHDMQSVCLEYVLDDRSSHLIEFFFQDIPEHQSLDMPIFYRVNKLGFQEFAILKKFVGVDALRIIRLIALTLENNISALTEGRYHLLGTSQIWHDIPGRSGRWNIVPIGV